ncbi:MULTISPECIES: hypothetical protein [unclassified Nocardia]|uniref:hypothetical protein n=1 Tax=unclassified Nocardia TaxID=2637762 RepID=UPI00260978F1|nr:MULTISPECIES: hypothetical protein [unclassified Nocardia]MCU1642423.1 hypothetical protein [Nocardia sp.]WSJ19241.1 hypothetical protein OG326_18310 [Nocardia sp. NBC_01327]
MEWLLGLLGGVIGGGIGGAKSPFGPAVSGGAGAIGGGITGAIIQAATGSGLDFGQILAQVGGGGVVGAVVAAVIGFATKPKASNIR